VQNISPKFLTMMTATQDVLQIWQTLGCKVVKLFVDHYNKMLRQQLAMEPSLFP